MGERRREIGKRGEDAAAKYIKKRGYKIVERNFTCGLETDCANGVDDDSDGATDCFDLDCTGDPSCP